MSSYRTDWNRFYSIPLNYRHTHIHVIVHSQTSFTYLDSTAMMSHAISRMSCPRSPFYLSRFASPFLDAGATLRCRSCISVDRDQEREIVENHTAILHIEKGYRNHLDRTAREKKSSDESTLSFIVPCFRLNEFSHLDSLFFISIQ